MTAHVDIWLRGTDFATTDNIEGIAHDPDAWIDDDVRVVLEGMLQAMDRASNRGRARCVAALRGFSWIVNPFEEGGVLIAIEMALGAAVAGPFAIDKAVLEAMIGRVLAAQPPTTPSTVVH